MPSAIETEGMAKTTRRHSSDEEYRKPFRMIRIRLRLAKQGDILATRLEKKLTEIVNDALRAELERNGLWPPPERSK